MKRSEAITELAVFLAGDTLQKSNSLHEAAEKLMHFLERDLEMQAPRVCVADGGAWDDENPESGAY